MYWKLLRRRKLIREIIICCMGWRFLGRGRKIGLILGILGRLGSFMAGIIEIANRNQEITAYSTKKPHSSIPQYLLTPTPTLNIVNLNPKTSQSINYFRNYN